MAEEAGDEQGERNHGVAPDEQQPDLDACDSKCSNGCDRWRERWRRLSLWERERLVNAPPAACCQPMPGRTIYELCALPHALTVAVECEDGQVGDGAKGQEGGSIRDVQQQEPGVLHQPASTHAVRRGAVSFTCQQRQVEQVL